MVLDIPSVMTALSFKGLMTIKVQIMNIVHSVSTKHFNKAALLMLTTAVALHDSENIKRCQLRGSQNTRFYWFVINLCVAVG